MARLPTINGDDGNWGTVLNDYLSQSHNPDGSLKAAAVSAAGGGSGSIADGSVTTSKIADGAVSTNKIPDLAITNVKLLGSIDQSKITGLTAGLAAKAEKTELDTAISGVNAGIPQKVKDTMATTLVAGSNVTITPGTSNATITIAATGGGASAPSTGRNPLTGYWHLSGYPGVDPTGAADQTAILQQIVNDIATAGGGVIWVDAGTYRLNGTVIWKSKVSMIGVDRTLVKFVGYQVDTAMIRAIPSDGTSTAAPLSDVTFSDFHLDGANQTLSGSYVSALKGFFIQHMRRVTFNNLWVSDTGATGVGVDFAYEAVVFDSCIVTGCGRLNPGNGPGGSGIGIGTASNTNDEPFTVTRCYVVNNTRFGIFVESQNESGTNAFSMSTRGGRITDNFVSGGQYGIGDAGNRNLLIAHNQVKLATNAGIVVNGGTFTQGRTGFDGEISDNLVYQCVVGIYIDYAKVNTISYAGQYTIRDNHISDSTQNGILIEMRTVTVDAVHILSNEINNCGRTGLLVQYNGTGPTAIFRRSSVRDNIVYGNGTAGVTGSNDGIRFSVPIQDTDVYGNKCFDHQATKTQRYGMVSSSTVTGGRIVFNDLRGNLTGAALFTTTPTGVHFASNPGYAAPVPQAVTVGASPWSYTAPDYPTNLYLTGGTVSAITQGGVTVASASERVIPAEPGDVIVVTYSAAPTVATRPRA